MLCPVVAVVVAVFPGSSSRRIAVAGNKKGEAFPSRRSIRLPRCDYRSAGGYFITICTHRKQPLFGRVHNRQMHRNAYGQIAHEFWEAIPEHSAHAELDVFMVMPNHVHGIVILHGGDSGTACCAPTAGAPLRQFQEVLAGSASTIVRSYKSAVTREIRRQRGDPRWTVWHGNYFERVICNDRELEAIRQYIVENPIRWSIDRENPEAVEVEDVLPWETGRAFDHEANRKSAF